MRKSLFAYPWELLDRGLCAAAEEIRALGVGKISLALIYHQARLLLPNNPRRKLYAHPGGSCYFPFSQKSERFGLSSKKTCSTGPNTAKPLSSMIIQATFCGSLSL